TMIERGHELSILPDSRPPENSLPNPLTDHFFRPLSRPADVHIRQKWPPDWTSPPAGHWVVMQPWEFGSLPKSWVGPMTELADEIWAYTAFVRDCCIKSSVPADRVHVVPLGIDTNRFHQDNPPLPLRTKKRFKFLFVGGTIFRKGIDVLLA